MFKKYTYVKYYPDQRTGVCPLLVWHVKGVSNISDLSYGLERRLAKTVEHAILLLKGGLGKQNQTKSNQTKPNPPPQGWVGEAINRKKPKPGHIYSSNNNNLYKKVCFWYYPWKIWQNPWKCK